MIAASAFEHRRQMGKIGKPVDRAEWQMSPPTVNAYYDAQLNEMVFPAGILQPPFYANAAPMPTNFGGIGMVMGHELTHGFDDEGRQFDAEGNLKDWWRAAVNTEFERRAECVKKQFDGYVVLGDVHVNGKLTLGENIADLGGVKLAYRAMKTKNASSKRTRKGEFTRRAGVLPRLRAELVRQAPRRGAPPPGRDEPALAAQLPRQRPALEPARVRAGVLVQARREDGAEGSLRGLVS